MTRKRRSRPTTLQTVAALLREGHLERAATAVERHLRDWPEDREALHLAGLIALQGREPDRATDLLLRASAVDRAAGRGDDAALLTNLGAAQAAAGELSAALATLERACETPPPNAAALFNLGLLRRRLGRDDEAATAFEEALAVDPRHRGARKSLAATKLDLGRWSEALQLTQALLAAEPASAELHFNAGLAARALGRFEAALRHLDAAPAGAATALEQASCLQELGRWEEALGTYRRALSEDPAALAAIAKRMAAGSRGRLPASPGALRLLLGEA